MRRSGEIIYTLTILDIRPDGIEAILEVDAIAFAGLQFLSFLGQQWEIPIRVVSRNIPIF